MALLGGVRELNDVNDSKVAEELGHFAVKEYNKNEGKDLHFKKVVAARQKVVQGVMFYLDIEASEGFIHHHHRIYEAIVWQKPGAEPKSLEKFVMKGDENVSKLSEYKFTTLPIDDPSVVEAAERAVEKLNADRKNVANYALVQVTSARVKLTRVSHNNSPVSCLGKVLLCGKGAIEKEAYDIDMKVGKSEAQEAVNARILRSLEGDWHVNHATIVKSGWTFTV